MSDRVQGLFEAKIRKVVLAYERGAELKAIASRVGVSAPTVAKWLTKEGYKHKKKGRIPLAMKARVRDLHKRGWGPESISTLLKLDPQYVDTFSKPIENPILGGEKDPLKVKGLKKRKKKEKIKGRRRGRPRKEIPTTKEKWPPPRHKCRKHWTPVEEAYVLQLMEKKIQPIVIYRRMRASKKRQAKIWKKYGNKGRPPNFPPPGTPFTPEGPVLPPAEVVKRKERVKAIESESKKRLQLLEAQSLEQEQRIAELDSKILADKQRLEALKKRSKQLQAEREKTEEQLDIAEEITVAKPPKPARVRVLPGSYEAVEMGLPVGQLIAKKKPGKKPLPKPKHLGEYADNGKYFTVSRDWKELKDARNDELRLLADYLSRHRLPAKATKGGKMPKAYLNSTWPASMDKRWSKEVSRGLDLLVRYRKRVTKLRKQKMRSPSILRYLSLMYAAERKGLTGSAKRAALSELLAHWNSIRGNLDRLIMIHYMKIADQDGMPTKKGIEMSRAAWARTKQEQAARIEREKLKKRRAALKSSEQKKAEELDRQIKALQVASQVPEDEDEDDDEYFIRPEQRALPAPEPEEDDEDDYVDEEEDDEYEE